MADPHATDSRVCPCGWTGEYVYAGSMTGRKECPRCGRYESEARNATPDRAACRVYWGSHACHLPRGHRDDHWCDCCECEDHANTNVDADGVLCVAGPPYYGAKTRFYGEDAS